MNPENQQAQRSRWLAEQKKWIESCGGDLAGYIAKYGADRGPAIYQADTDALNLVNGC